MPLHPAAIPVLDAMNANMAAIPQVPVEQIPLLRQGPLAPPPATPTPVARVEDRHIPGPAGDMTVRIYWPEAGSPAPLVVFFHGGGFVLCSLDSHDELCRALCREAGVVLVSVDYRLAPEAPYPAAADDCYAALAWAVSNAAELGADPTRVAVAGDSAGGNLAAVTALRARDLGGPALRHQCLIYPVTDCRFDTPSYIENAEGYFLTAEAMRWFWSHYLQDMGRAAEPYASPLRAPSLAGLPPALVITAEYDPLRDEGEHYAQALSAAGVSTTLRRYDGMIHGFVTLAEIFEDGLAARSLAASHLREALA
jgi:acetyl esterase